MKRTIIYISELQTGTGMWRCSYLSFWGMQKQRSLNHTGITQPCFLERKTKLITQDYLLLFI